MKSEGPHTSASLPPLAQGERRRVTIWMADLCGYTALNEVFDPEEVEAVMDRFEGEATRVVHEHGGVVNQFVGDEVVALFGVPTAHEDDPQRAVSSALELHRYVRELGNELEPKLRRALRLHTGVHSGLVLARARDPRHGLYSLRGDTINVAARLRSLARPDELLASESTQRHIAPFYSSERLDSFVLRGRAAPVTAYRVLAPTSTSTAFEAAQASGLVPLAGRARELSVLMECYERARAGHGQLVTLAGHAGVGKSRLLHEFRQRIDDTATVFHTRCEAYGKVTPFQAFLRPVRQALGLAEARAGQMPAAHLRESLDALDLARYFDVFASLLGVSSDVTPSVRGEQLRDLLLRALVDLFLAVASRKPTVLLMEDWHFADEGSGTATVHLARSIAEHRILVAVSHRPIDAIPWGASRTAAIELCPLAPEETAELAASLLGSGLPDWLVNAIHDHTGGNAFFVEQVCRAFGDAKWNWSESLQIGIGERGGQLPIPDTVHAVLRARIDSLHPWDAEILRFASVLGAEFPLSRLRLLVEGSPEEDVDLMQCMRRLAAADLVHPSEPGEADVHQFKHVITQEVAYETLLRQRRRELHARAARAIEQSSADALDEHCEALAYHYEAGDEFGRAADFAERAGDKAARTFSLEEARQRYRQSVACLDRLVSTPERVQKRVDVGLKWAAACMFKPAPEQLEVLKDSLEQARRIGYGRGAAYTLCWLGCIEYALGNQGTAIAQFAECLPLAEQLGDDRLVAQLHVNLGQSYAAATQYDKALEHLTEGLDRKDRVPSVRPGAREPARAASSGIGRAYAVGYLGLVYGELGRFEEAYSYLDEALSMVRAARSRALEGSILTQLGMVQLWQGAWDASRETAALMQGTAERVHGPYILAMSKTVSGYAKFMSGEEEEGLELLQVATDWLESTRIGLTLSWNHACLAEALALSDRAEDATQHARRALERRAASDLLGEAPAHRALGVLEGNAVGSWPVAFEHFGRALAASHRKGSPREAAITQFRGAVVALRFKQFDLAANWLRDAFTQFAAMKMDSYSTQARSLASKVPGEILDGWAD